MASASQLKQRATKLANRAIPKLAIRTRSTRHIATICSQPVNDARHQIQPHRWQRNTILSTVTGSSFPNSRPIHSFCVSPISQRSTARLPPILFRQLHQSRHASTQPDKGDEAKPAPTVIPTTPTLRPHENIYTIPNMLTFSRLLAAPAVGYFILTSQPLAALCLFFYAGATDALDGYLARRYHSQTVVGTVIDPMADKALMTIAVIALTVQHIFPIWLAVIILGRDIGLAISAIYFRWISLPPPKTMARYWDFSLPSAEVRPTEISKINTLLQLLLVGCAMVVPVMPGGLVQAWNLWGVLEGWEGLVAATTVWSGLSYVWNKDAVKILSRDEIERRMETKAEDKAEGGKV